MILPYEEDFGRYYVNTFMYSVKHKQPVYVRRIEREEGEEDKYTIYLYGLRNQDPLQTRTLTVPFTFDMDVQSVLLPLFIKPQYVYVPRPLMDFVRASINPQAWPKEVIFPEETSAFLWTSHRRMFSRSLSFSVCNSTFLANMPSWEEEYKKSMTFCGQPQMLTYENITDNELVRNSPRLTISEYMMGSRPSRDAEHRIRYRTRAGLDGVAYTYTGTSACFEEPVMDTVHRITMFLFFLHAIQSSSYSATTALEEVLGNEKTSYPASPNFCFFRGTEGDVYLFYKTHLCGTWAKKHDSLLLYKNYEYLYDELRELSVGPILFRS